MNLKTHTSASRAMSICWMIWASAVVLSAGGVGSVLAFGTTGRTVEPGPVWYVLVGVIYLVLIPLSGLLHWQIYRRHWRDGVVQPAGYVKASAALWIGLTVSVIGICVLSILRRAILPDLPMALPPMLMLLGTWPSGWAMRQHVDSLDEEAAVEEDEVFHTPPEQSAARNSTP